jgi:hypothetical protein
MQISLRHLWSFSEAGEMISLKLLRRIIRDCEVKGAKKDEDIK